jgi:hypothetical protein
MKKFMKLLPFALAAILWFLIFGYAWTNEVGSTGLVGLAMLYVGLCMIIIGIVRDQFKEPKPILNLGVICVGSILTIIAAVQLAYISDLFEKWVSYILMTAVFAMSFIYILILAQKKAYDVEAKDEDDI